MKKIQSYTSLAKDNRKRLKLLREQSVLYNIPYEALLEWWFVRHKIPSGDYSRFLEWIRTYHTGGNHANYC